MLTWNLTVIRSKRRRISSLHMLDTNWFCKHMGDYLWQEITEGVWALREQISVWFAVSSADKQKRLILFAAQLSFWATPLHEVKPIGLFFSPVYLLARAVKQRRAWKRIIPQSPTSGAFSPLRFYDATWPNLLQRWIRRPRQRTFQQWLKPFPVGFRVGRGQAVSPVSPWHCWQAPR